MSLRSALDADCGGAESSLTASIQAYATQSGAFFKELTTTPLLPMTSTTHVGGGGSKDCGGMGGLSGIATTMTLGNLAETVQNLTKRVGRLEALVQALDSTRRSQASVSHATAMSRHDQQLLQDAALQPIKQTIQYHEHTLADLAVCIEELRQSNEKHLKQQQEFTEKFMIQQQHQHQLARTLRDQNMAAGGGGGGYALGPDQGRSSSDIQKSMQRMTNLANSIQKQRKDLVSRMQQQGGEGLGGGDSLEVSDVSRDGAGAGNTLQHQHQHQQDNQRMPIVANASEMLRDDRPRLTAAGEIIEGATTDDTTENPASTVAMDNLSNIDGVAGGLGGAGGHSMTFGDQSQHMVTATTVQMHDISRTYQADISNVSAGDSMSQPTAGGGGGPRGGTWKSRNPAGTANSTKSSIDAQVREVLRPGGGAVHHGRMDVSPSTDQSSPMGTATTVPTDSTPDS